jgi:hypothetical protein
MPSDVLVLHHGQDRIFVGPRTGKREPARDKAFARRLFREALIQSQNAVAVRMAAEVWGLAGVGGGRELDGDLCERIVGMVDAGQLEIRRAPILAIDGKAENALRSFPAGALPEKLESVDLPQRIAACLDLVEKYLPASEQPLFREGFGDDGRMRLIAAAMQRLPRLSARSFEGGARTLQAPMGIFGDFGEQLDVIDWLVLRLSQAQSASDLGAAASELAAFIQQVGVAFFVRAIKSLRVWRPMPAGPAEPAAPPARTAPAPREATPGPAPAPEKEFPNESAQAATLKEAAKNGTPFCEICEKKKAEQMRKAG